MRNCTPSRWCLRSLAARNGSTSMRENFLSWQPDPTDGARETAVRGSGCGRAGGRVFCVRVCVCGGVCFCLFVCVRENCFPADAFVFQSE